MTTINRAASAEAAPCVCANDPNIRILRRVSSLEGFPLAERGDRPTRLVAIVDTETTGTDPLIDEIIDIAVVMIEVDDSGRIVGITRSGEALRDPHLPIPAAITQLTGITDEDVCGKSIDLDRLERLLARADVRIAHNASFDIAFIENLMPGLAGAAWACSVNDIDWLGAGFDGRKLGHLLMQIGRFSEAHRAMADVISLLHVLAHPLNDGSTILGHILENAERPTIRLEATGAAYEKRTVLRMRGYRWDARAKVWWIQIEENEQEAETAWLRQELGPWGPPPRATRLTWHQRHR